MLKKEALRPYLKRLAFILALSAVFVAIFNEFSYRLQKYDYDRGPQTIELVIPAGTAEQILAGKPVPTIPEEMIFVKGDVLVVKNEDTAIHQLGPLVVPPGSSSSLNLEQEEKTLVSCSFSKSRYLGLEVRHATTFTTRLTGLLLAAPTTTIILFMYSLLAWPVKPERIVSAAAPDPKISEHTAQGGG